MYMLDVIIEDRIEREGVIVLIQKDPVQMLQILEVSSSPDHPGPAPA